MKLVYLYLAGTCTIKGGSTVSTVTDIEGSKKRGFMFSNSEIRFQIDQVYLTYTSKLLLYSTYVTLYINFQRVSSDLNNSQYT